MTIEIKTLILKLHYFLHGAGAAPINPYLTIIMKQMGMNVSSMGPIIFIIQILGLVLKPVFGSLMDRCRRKTLIFQIVIAGTLVYYGLNILPPNGTYQEVFNLKVECSEQGQVQAVLTEAIVSDFCLKHKFNSVYRDKKIECIFHCMEANKQDFRFLGSFVGKKVDLIHKGHLHVALENKPNQKCSPDLKCSAKCPKSPEVQQVLNNYITTTRYLIIVFIWIIGQVCYSIVNSIQDAVCQKICRNLETNGLSEESKAHYGQQRTWCSVGYGLSAIFIGHFMDHYNETNLIYDYSPVFNLLLLLWSFDILLVGFLKIPDSSVYRENFQRSHQLRAVWSLISSNKSVMVFVLYVISVGICFGALSVHMLYLEDLGQRSDCNGSLAMKTLGGFVLMFHTVGEFPVFLFSHKLEAAMGSKGMMSLVLFTFSLRFLYYAIIQSPWAILLIELSSGLTTGVFWPAISSYNMSIAPENSSATMLSVTYAIFDACGVGIGSLLATVLYESLGGRLLFAIYSLFAFTAFILFQFAQFFVKDSFSFKKLEVEEEKESLIKNSNSIL